MNIRDWIATHPLGLRGKAIQQIADACRVTPPAVRHWIAGSRLISPSYWGAITKATKGAVTATDLLQDVQTKRAA
jgi:DNA-binding transcriptional regulator YdaS (Cro superfamily)